MKMNEEEEWCNHSRNETSAISVAKLHYALFLAALKQGLLLEKQSALTTMAHT